MKKKLWWGSLVAILLVIVISVVFFWLNREQWLADFNIERQQQTKKYMQMGSMFAKTATHDQCLQQSFSQLDKCFATKCTLDQAVFLKSCLASASTSEHFCDAVPEHSEKMTQDAKKWLKDSCWSKDLNGESCRFLYKQQIQFCSSNK